MQHTDHLQRWLKAGLIDESTAEAIREYESDAARGERSGSQPSLIEGVLYLGLIVVAAGVFALLAQNWEELQSPARVAAIGLPAALALVLGFALRTTGDAAFTRGGHLAWLLAVGLAFGTVLVIFHEWGADDDERNGLLAGALLGLALALLLWAISGSAVQVLGVAGAIFMFGQALGAWPDDFSTAIAGTAALIGAGLAIALAESGLFTPRWFAAIVLPVVAAAGAYEAGIDGELQWAEAMAFAVAGVLLALGVVRSTFSYLVVGVALAFLALVTVMFEYFESEIGAPVALIITGALLIASVIILIPMRRIGTVHRHA